MKCENGADMGTNAGAMYERNTCADTGGVAERASEVVGCVESKDNMCSNLGGREERASETSERSECVDVGLLRDLSDSGSKP